MSDWVAVELGEVVEFRNGVNFSQDDEGAGIPIIKVKDFGDLHFAPVAGLDELDSSKVRIPQNQFLNPGDIVIVRSNGNRDLVGRSMIFGGPPNTVTFSGFCIRARVDAKSALPAFIHYWLRSPLTRQTFSREGNGTGINNLSQGFLGKQKIQLPTLPEQDQIASVLSALDDKIELNRRMNETLEALAKTIFKDWFVDFGPVRRRQDGATDPVAILGSLIPDPVKAAPVAALFPDSFGEDGLPESWSAKPLGDFASSVSKTLQPSEIDPRTPYFGLEHLPRNSIMLSQWGEAKAIKSGKSSFKKRQILFGKLRPYFHKVGIAPVDGVCSTDIVVLDAKDAHDRAFVTCLVSSEAFVAFTDLGSEGTNMPRTSWSKMSTYMVAVGNAKTREAFGTLVQSLHDKILASISENRTLAATRDYLLPKLMSGEVRVRDAEKTVS